MNTDARDPLSYLFQSCSIVTGPRETTPWPPRGARGWLVGTRVALDGGEFAPWQGKGGAGVRRRLRWEGFCWTFLQDVGKLRSVGVHTEEVFIFLLVQRWRVWCLHRKSWRKQLHVGMASLLGGCVEGLQARHRPAVCSVWVGGAMGMRVTRLDWGWGLLRNWAFHSHVVWQSTSRYFPHVCVLYTDQVTEARKSKKSSILQQEEKPVSNLGILHFPLLTKLKNYA